MKKIICVVVSLFALMGLFGCGHSEYKHEHSFTKEVVAPTCSQEGYTLYTCKYCLTKEKRNIIEALVTDGHSYDNCVCTECGDFLVDQAVDTTALKITKEVDEDGNEYGEVYGVTGDPVYIKIPSTYNGLPVKRISKNAFQQLLSLRHVIIPDGVTCIGDHAFEDCYNLLSVSVPDSVVEIGHFAFCDCIKLKSVSLANITKVDSSILCRCRALKSIEIPQGVPSIDIYAFSGCSSLTSVTIPVSVKVIYFHAFELCNSLKEINYGGTISQWDAITKHVAVDPDENEDISWNAYTGNYIIYCTDGTRYKV